MVAVSLHTPDDEPRVSLIPINTRYSVDETFDVRPITTSR